MGELQMASFENILAKAKRKLLRVQWELEHTELLFKRGDLQGAYDRAFDLADASEKLTQLTRELPAHTGNPNAPFDLNALLLDSSGVKVGYTEQGWFSIQMPALLPRKERGSADYIRTMLYPSLHHFFSEKLPLYLESSVVAFRHVYDENRPEREYRDHDNIELNMVVDTLAMFTMKDDSPMRCRHYYCSSTGDKDRTEVYVLPREAFPAWLDYESTCPKTAIMLFSGQR